MKKSIAVLFLALSLDGQIASPLIAQTVHAPVTLGETENAFTLDNGIVSARILKRTGDLVSLKYHDLELLGQGSGHPGGYWSHTPRGGAHTVDVITIDPRTNSGDRAECSIKGFYQGQPLGSGPGGSASCDIEIRYALAHGDSALFTYTIFTHKAGYPQTSVGEARFAAKLRPEIFDFMTIDSRRRQIMPRPEDWDKGTQMNMKEARLLNTGIYKGKVEHKYDYSAVQFDIPAFGWSSTTNHVGFWFINPTIEYLSGGATKVELTGHLDNGNGADPTLLNYWRGSHYGGSSLVLGTDEPWTKVVGPFLIYCNSAVSHEQMWRDALDRAAHEKADWPYDWVTGVDYPHKDQRGTVTGQIILTDTYAPQASMSNILVGLAAPDYLPPRASTNNTNGVRAFGGSPRSIDWQMDAKYYQFWVRANKEGHFAIPAVRPGTYTLHVIADGVLGEFARSNIVVTAAQKLVLGQLNWQPVHYGRQLWDIGVADRTAGEFFHGDDYWHWGLYNDYPKEFPHDVNFFVNKSDYRKDWNFCQVPRSSGDGGGRGESTTWSVNFDLPASTHGKATLRLAFAAASARSVQVAINDHAVGSTGALLDTATIRRDGIRGYWCERDVAFDASLMKPGPNVIKLTVPAGGVMNGVEYDYLRLELDESAAPPTNDAANGNPSN